MSITTELEKLNDLKNNGTLTLEEFQAAKHKLLNSKEPKQRQFSGVVHFAANLVALWVIFGAIVSVVVIAILVSIFTSSSDSGEIKEPIVQNGLASERNDMQKRFEERKRDFHNFNHQGSSITQTK